MSLETLVLAFCMFGITTSVNGAKPSLQKYNVDPRSLTCSGFSSGGAMATQFHFAHSANVTGVGIFAGVPYCCATGGRPDLAVVLRCMKEPAQVNITRLVAQANKYAANRQIDPVSNVAHSRVYIFHGKADKTVAPGIGPKIAGMYKRYAVAKLKTEFGINAAHAFPTLNIGAPCGQPPTNGLNKCNYSGAYKMLNHVYGGGLVAPVGGEGLRANIQDYDQTKFMTESPLMSGLAANAYLYVPTACKNGAVCRLHVGFHPCSGSETDYGYNYALKTGQADVAEVNNIIMLMPQVKPNPPSNPTGCWDWWGYTNEQYPTRKGPQIDAVYKMVNRVINGV